MEGGGIAPTLNRHERYTLNKFLFRLHRKVWNSIMKQE